MTIQEYHDLWEQDAKIDNSEVDAETRKVPLLHAKWWRYYTAEKLRYKKLEMDYKAMYRLRYEYWWGRLDDATRKEHGWEIQPLKILTPQIPMYLDSDPVLAELIKKREYQTELCRFLEDVIKSINSRGYLLNTITSFLKFKMGV